MGRAAAPPAPATRAASTSAAGPGHHFNLSSASLHPTARGRAGSQLPAMILEAKFGQCRCRRQH
jgi:hypothetical protein